MTPSTYSYAGRGHAVLALASVLLLAANVAAQSRPAVPTMRGKIAAVAGHELTVAASQGTVKAALTEKTVVRVEEAIELADIGAGMYLGTTAVKQPDGRFLASEVHVFSEDQRGTGEGHRPLSSAPASGATMTNANVERVEDVAVRDVKGRALTLKYRGGEVTVLVPPGIPVVRRVVRDKGSLRAGQEISFQAARDESGALTATQITVRAAGR